MVMMQKKKPRTAPRSVHVKKGDTVMVIAGKDKGKTGTVRKVLKDQGKVVVEGLNMIKKAVRPNPFLGQQGGIVEMEAPIFASKVMVYDLKTNQPTRIRHEVVEGKRVRVAKKSGEHLDA